MSAAAAAEILVAATDLDDRLLECLADCGATFVRTFEEAQRAIRGQWFRMIVIDLNFDSVRMFDLLQHIRSLADLNGVPVLCVQGAEAGAGIGAALDRLVRMLGGKAFVDLRGDDEVLAGGPQRLRRMVRAELGMQAPHRRAARGGARGRNDEGGPNCCHRLCILTIDHDVDAAHRLGEIVEQMGHDVDFAYDGPAGLDAARRLRPDVVFVDVALPRLDGYQLARRLRREPCLRDLLIVALTAAAGEEDRRRMHEAGFDHCVVKPADPEAVRELLQLTTS